MSAEDRWLSAWLALILAAAALMIAVNARLFHFTGAAYFPPKASWLLPPLVGMAAFGAHMRRSAPRDAFIVRNFAFFALLVIATLILTTGMQYTPFAPIDARLARWDRALGFDVVGAAAWTGGHPALERLLQLAYAALDAELPLLPVAVLFLHDERSTRVFLYAAAYSFLVGALVYYFFPSSGPASLLPSPFFLPEERLTGLKFYQVHHLQPVTTLAGGMVAFPSFHAAWAVLLSYAARPRRWLLAAAGALNALVILSTLLLGWHFLVDVLAGAALAGACLAAGERTHRRLRPASLDSAGFSA